MMPKREKPLDALLELLAKAVRATDRHYKHCIWLFVGTPCFDCNEKALEEERLRKACVEADKARRKDG
jgi:hypothetical protein